MVTLDFRTVLVVQATIMLTIGISTLFYWRRHRSVPGLGLWGAAAFCLGLGTSGVLLFDAAPLWFAMPFTYGFVTLGTWTAWNGLRAFNGRHLIWVPPLAVIALTMLFLVCSKLTDQPFAVRVITLSAVMALEWGCCAYETIRWTPPPLRPTHLPAAVAFVSAAVNSGSRAVLVAFGVPWTSMLDPPPQEAVHSLVGVIGTILVSYGLLMLANQRLQYQLERRSTELEALAAERDRSRDRAEQASRAKSEFLAKMSHELRTPLNGILGFSALAQSLPDSERLGGELRQYFTYIHESGGHLLALINDILDLAKIEAGKLELVPVALDIAQAVQGVSRMLGDPIRESGHSLTVEIADPVPSLVADERAVKQILLNLLGNAIRFTPDGGAIRVAVRSAAQGGTEVLVADTGVGISADQLERVLRPFEQVDNSYTRDHGGTGLGLPMVDGLMRLHGGTLRIASTPGEGTTATLWFPPRSAGWQPRVEVAEPGSLRG